MARAIDALTTDQATLSMVYKKLFEKKTVIFSLFNAFRLKKNNLLSLQDITW